jgi:hypothetical protein
MSCRTYDPCLDSKLNQIGSYASVARQSAQASQTSATQSAASASASATSATNSQNSANDSADSASEANNYLTQVENIFNEFEEKYLGAFAIAPTTDNQGDPLQVGALYWNSVTNAMFVWNGSAWSPIQTSQLYLGGFAIAPTLNNQGLPLVSGNLYWNTASNNLWAHNGATWVRTNFNETTPFLATGTTFARTLANRLADVVNVLDFGADPTGVLDSKTAILNAIGVGKSVYFPDGTYKFVVTTTNAITPAINATIFGNGNGSIIEFETANTVNFLNIFNLNQSNVTIRDLKINWTTPSTTAGGIGLFAFNGGNNYTINNIEAYLDTQETGGVRNAPNHIFMINASVNDVYISNSKFTRATFGILKTNTSTATNKNWEFNSNIFENFFAPQLTFNTPSGDWDNVRVINNELRNSLAHTLTGAPSIHMGGLAGGSGSGRFLWANNTFTGTGQGIHFEEGAEEVIIDGNNFATTDIAIQILDNIVGGAPLTPARFIISNNTIVQTGTKVKPIVNIGIDCIFDASAHPAVRNILISDNIIKNWEEGIKCAEEGYQYKISNNLIMDCDIGIKVTDSVDLFGNTFENCNNGIIESFNGALIGNNRFQSCTTPIDSTGVNGIATSGEEYYINNFSLPNGNGQIIPICPIGTRRDIKATIYLVGGSSRRFATFNTAWDGTTLTGGTPTLTSGGGTIFNLVLQENAGILNVLVNNGSGSAQIVDVTVFINGGSFYF